MKKGNKLDSADWISNLKLLVVTLKSSAACTPVPCLQSIFEAVSAVLDLVERVGKNDTDLKYLSESVIKITELLADELNSHSDSLDVRLVELCNDFGRYLNLVGSAVDKTLLRKSKFWLRKYLKAKSIRDSLDDFTRRLSDLRADLTLSAALGARFQIVDTDRRVQEIQRSLAHSSPEISAPKTFELSGIEEDILVFKPSELYLNFNTVYVSKVTLSGAEEQHRGVIRTYGARVGPAITTVRVYEGLHARQMWKRDLYMFAEHLRVPGVAQIYGMCTSPRLQALVFHDELVPIDIYAAAIKSAIQYVDFELSLIRNFESVFTHIATLIDVADADYRETVADLAVISRTTGALLISHLPYNNGAQGGVEGAITEKPIAGPIHTWFSSCGCLASTPQGETEANAQAPAVVSLQLERRWSFDSLHSFCVTAGSLSRYRGLALTGGNQNDLKLGSIYLQQPDNSEVLTTFAEVPILDSEIIIEDWTPRKGVFEELSEGWTRFEVLLRTDFAEPGYFLSLHGSVYMPVPERERLRAAWLIQAHSMLRKSPLLQHGWSHQDLLIAELFFINLDWQIVPPAWMFENPGLPMKLYVFVENMPVDSRGCTTKPTTFWSVHPDGNVPDLPSGLRSEEWVSFGARGSGRSGEAYHYDAARALQERHGFDPATNAAADSFGLPRYELSSRAIPDK